jgi:hypothetical protein
MKLTMTFILFTILFTVSVILHIQAAVIEGKSLWKRNDDMALLEREEENINLEREKRQLDEDEVELIQPEHSRIKPPKVLIDKAIGAAKWIGDKAKDAGKWIAKTVGESAIGEAVSDGYDYIKEKLSG